jgi:hypothetical protein
MKVQAPAGDKVTVYNMKTGKPDQCFAIDAQERLNRGGWSLEPVEVQQFEKDEATGGFRLAEGQEVAIDPLAESEPELQPEPEAKKKPGRKPKSV